MINSVGSMGNMGMGGMQGMGRPMGPPPNVSLSDSEKETAQSIISQYTAEDATEEDLLTMLKELREADIGPGEDLKNILEANGFEVQGPQGAKGPQGGQGGGRGGPPPGGGMRGVGMNAQEMPDFMTDFLDKYESGDTTEEDVQSFLEQLLEQRYNTSGNLFNQLI